MPDQRLIEKLKTVPQKPGVYTFKGRHERVLYVGKAKNLKNRLRSYFHKSSNLDARKSSMMNFVRDFSFLSTESELEALVLEANLIKQYKPKYNIILRDDKNYPYLKLTIKEEWPRIDVVRGVKKDGSMYFGPYVPSSAMWEALSFIRRHFVIRPCRYSLDKPLRPCIEHQMGRCPAPCAGKISTNEYRKIVDEIIMFLKGKKKGLIEGLEKQMRELSDELRYEDAARIRDRITALKRAWESQKVIDPGLGDMDVIGHHMEAGNAVFQILFIRNGIMLGAKDFYLKDIGDIQIHELYHSVIEMFYAKDIMPPPELVVRHKPSEENNIIQWLAEKRGDGLKFTEPKSGKRFELLKMAQENAKLSLSNRVGKTDKLLELKERLSLPDIPHTIGAFDISNLAGSEAVGAYIEWSQGEFDKDNYRHVKINTVEGIDDYAMMYEAVGRVLNIIQPPDLIVIDGGKGQLESARASIECMDKTIYDDISNHLISVAKKPDRAFTLKSGEPLDLEDRSPSSLLLKKIRDEVHRFALSFHKKLRAKRVLESPLEKVKGVSKKRRLSLLKEFGSIEAIKSATIQELAGAPGMNKKVAEELKKTLG